VVWQITHNVQGPTTAGAFTFNLILNYNGTNYTLDSASNTTGIDPFSDVMCRTYGGAMNPTYLFSWFNSATETLMYGFIVTNNAVISKWFSYIDSFAPGEWPHDCYKSVETFSKYAAGYARACYKEGERR
jgi:hypothetical protein